MEEEEEEEEEEEDKGSPERFCGTLGRKEAGRC